MTFVDDLIPPRPDARRFAAALIITGAVFIAAGHTLRQPAFMTANDISRWCTVWSLLERGTYAIDECPWQGDTQDKIQWPPRKEGDPAPAEGQPDGRHYYSSKPALISTLIAGMLYPARRITGVPLDRVILQERAERWTQKPDPDHPGRFKPVLERPKDPVKWPAYIFYFKPTLILINVLPFGLFLIYFSRVLDRYAPNDWAWLFSLFAAAFGTYLLPYTQTLNNHTIGAFAAFFALDQFLRIWDEGLDRGWRFAAAGFFAGFAASTELPALAFPALLGPMLLLRYPKQTLLFFVPGLAFPLAAFIGAQYLEFGQFFLPYESFGSDAYLWEGSIWQTPLELDAFNKTPEPYWVYLWHMTFGHHGIFSLTPIYLLSVWGGMKLLSGGRWLTALAILTFLVVAGLGGYFLYDPSAWMVDGRLLDWHGWAQSESPAQSGVVTVGRLHRYVWVLAVIPTFLALLALVAGLPVLRRSARPMSAVAWMTAVLTVVVLAFYAYTPKARNYGGSAQGLRWIMWLIPFWLLLLPSGVEAGQARGRARRLALVTLAISAISVGYAIRNPWSHPWILDAMEHLGIYSLSR